MARPRKVQFETPCIECLQEVFLELSTHPRYFGHVATREGIQSYTKDGHCEWCADILLDWSFMGNAEELWWDSLPGVDTQTDTP